MENIKEYQTLKEQGLITLGKVGDSFAISSKRFDEKTGERIADEVAAIDLAQLEEKKSQLLAEIADIDIVIADCKSVDDAGAENPVL